MQNKNTRHIILLYDQECPMCANYSRMLRLQESLGQLVLQNAREPSALLDEITALGWDIDQGMVVKVEQQLYYASDAMHALSLMSSRSGIFNRISYWVFKSKLLAKILYPLMKTGRNLLLKLLGKEKINNLHQEHSKKL